MRILGINEYSHDTSVSIIKNNKIIIMLEEERFNGKKHSLGFMYTKDGFPFKSLDAALSFSNLSIKDIDIITLGWNLNYWKAMYNALQQCKNHYKMNPNNHYSYYKLFMNITKNYFERNKVLKRLFLNKKVICVDHHLAHAASTYRCSSFEKALIFVVDGAGETEWMSIFIGEKNTIRLLKKFSIKSSFGNVYTFATNLLGFGDFSEGKFMGLAAFGKALDDVFLDFDTSKEKFIIDYKKIQIYNKYRLNSDKNIRQIHKDICATFQKNFSDCLLKCYLHYINKTKIQNICIAGGIGFNCLLNGMLVNHPDVKGFYCPNFTGDMGVSLGSALEVSSYYNPVYALNVKTASFGLYPLINVNELRQKFPELIFKKIARNKAPEFLAEKLAKNKIIGIIIGRFEFGPRALGNRSILANPSIKKFHLKINRIKNRQKWRPLACMILRDKIPEVVESNKKDYPFMNIALFVKDKKKLAGVTHFDTTTRIQTISRSNRFFYNLLNNFYSITGIPSILNTSFNAPNKPLVSSTVDAINFFINSDIDGLYINQWYIERIKKFNLSEPRWLQEIIKKKEYPKIQKPSKMRIVKGGYKLSLKYSPKRYKSFILKRKLGKFLIVYNSDSCEVKIYNV